MPIYDFVCSECGSKRPVMTDFQSQKGLELLCIQCGGIMRSNPINMFSLIRSSKDKGPVEQRKVKPCGHTHHCQCAAIKQTKPNPFQKQIDEALGIAENE